MSKKLFNILAILLLMVYASNTLAMKRANDSGGERSSEWKDAPPEILEIIFSDLNLAQNAACALVCSAWGSIFAFGDYQRFKDKFDQLEADFHNNSTLKNAGVVLCHLRGACSELNRVRARSQEEQTRFVKSLCPNIWGGAEEEAEIFWIDLALIRAFDGRMEESSDSVIFNLALKVVVYDWNLLLIMGNKSWKGYSKWAGDIQDVFAFEYCDRNIEIFKRDKVALRKGVDAHKFFLYLRSEYAMKNTIAKLPAQSLIELGLTYYLKSAKYGLNKSSEEGVGLFLLAAVKKDMSILDKATGELLYKFAHASCEVGSPEETIFFCEKALNEVNSDEEEGIHRAYLIYHVGKSYMYLANWNKALEYFECIISSNKNSQHFHNSTLTFVGYAYGKLKLWEKAAEYFDKAMVEKGKWAHIPDADYGLIADAYYYSNNFEKARKMYTICFVNYGCGNSYNPRMSPESYMNAAMAFGKSGNEEDVSTASACLGMASSRFLENGMIDKAFAAFERAAILCNKNGNYGLEALCYLKAADYATQAGRLREASRFHQQSVEANSKQCSDSAASSGRHPKK